MGCRGAGQGLRRQSALAPGGRQDRRPLRESRRRASASVRDPGVFELAPGGVTQQMVIPGNNLDEILGKPSSDDFQDPTVQCLYMSISLLLIA